jgi:hypothetical protein
MKFVKYLLCIFIFSILIVFVSSVLTTKNVDIKLIESNKDLVNYVVTIVGFVLTALGFAFVVSQISSLAIQINKQEEQYHKDSEFNNFLKATKMLTATDNESNATAQISAMYLLYDYAKKYPNNIEKVIRVLNRFAVPFFYPEMKSKDKRIINEWKENGTHLEQVASVALELSRNTKLEYGIIYNKNEACFQDWEEYKKFKDSHISN